MSYEVIVDPNGNPPFEFLKVTWLLNWIHIDFISKEPHNFTNGNEIMYLKWHH